MPKRKKKASAAKRSPKSSKPKLRLSLMARAAGARKMTVVRL